MLPNVDQTSRPCWALIWMWILSIAQYAYRYILQVNDARTTSYYESTPPALSAIKYGLLLIFAGYGIARFFRTPVQAGALYRKPMQLTVGGILILGSVLLIRASVLPGNFSETGLCAVQLLPWLASVLLVPLFVERNHGLIRTFATFEHVAFWITFTFWLTTVCLALAGLRYPALSYPGVLLRFGGILDDPNGYACLCLLLMMLAVGIRGRGWILRGVIYGVMIAETWSLTGYITAIVMCSCLVAFRIYRTKERTIQWLLIACGICGIALALSVVLPSIYNLNQAIEAFDTIYSAKGSSATTHLLDLAPTEATMQEASVIGVLFGTGEFSENLYWRILANFGLIGLFVIGALLTIWCYAGFGLKERWRCALTAWNIGILIGSNGIAYLLTFPLGLIFWSALAFVAYWGRADAIARSKMVRQPSRTPA